MKKIFKSVFHKHSAYKRVNSKKNKVLRDIEARIGDLLDIKYTYESNESIYWKAEGMIEAYQAIYKIIKERF